MPRREPEEQAEDLFPVEDIPAPTGGTNLAELEAAIAAGRRSSRLVDEDRALLQAARTAAVAMDHAMRSKQPAYAVAACLRPYQDVLDRLGLNGRAELPPAGGAQSGTAALIEALSGGPDPT